MSEIFICFVVLNKLRKHCISVGAVVDRPYSVCSSSHAYLARFQCTSNTGTQRTIRFANAKCARILFPFFLKTNETYVRTKERKEKKTRKKNSTRKSNFTSYTIEDKRNIYIQEEDVEQETGKRKFIRIEKLLNQINNRVNLSRRFIVVFFFEKHEFENVPRAIIKSNKQTNN